MTNNQIKQEVIRVLDELVSDISQEDYKDVLEDLASDIEGRIDAVTEELEDND